MHKQRKKLINFIFLNAGCSLLRAERFSYSLDVLYESLGISKLSTKKDLFPDPDSLEMLDPGPDQ